MNGGKLRECCDCGLFVRHRSLVLVPLWLWSALDSLNEGGTRPQVEQLKFGRGRGAASQRARPGFLVWAGSRRLTDLLIVPISVSRAAVVLVLFFGCCHLPFFWGIGS